MAATRFYFQNSGTPPVSPAFAVNWNQTGQADRVLLLPKPQLDVTTTLTDKTVTVPITTTQNILIRQYVSAPLHAVCFQQSVSLSMVIRCLESALTANAQMALSINLCNQDGSNIRNLFGNFAIGSEFAASAATVSFSQGYNLLVGKPGDRLTVEIGVHAAAPTAATTATMRFGTSAASDFALTTGLTTDLNPWIEFGQDLYNVDNNNYRSVRVGEGMSTGERAR